MKKDRYTYSDLIEIMRILRSEKGCPWDREQTHKTLRKYLIEETYEVIEALDLDNSKKMCEELGDLLLQVVFHAQIAEENNEFNMEDIIDGISRKMVNRHTHVFGEDSADTPDQVMDNWEKIKKKEKGLNNHTGILRDVPSGLPSLMRSYKVQNKASKVGFDWDNVNDVMEKVKEEFEELEEVYKSKNVARINEELGDLLFSVVNLSRFLEIQPELALKDTIEKFIQRFEYVESQSLKSGKNLEDMTLAEMDEYWNESKTKLYKKEEV